VEAAGVGAAPVVWVHDVKPLPKVAHRTIMRATRSENRVPTAFLLTPFSAKGAGGEKPSVYRKVQDAITQATADAGVDLRRADSIFRPGVIVDQIKDEIERADLVIAVCTGKNANVFYELGLAEALGHTPILIAPNARHLPFDKAHCRCHMYGLKRLTTANLRERVARAIEETLAAEDGQLPGR
jgi:hypothetical protein